MIRKNALVRGQLNVLNDSSFLTRRWFTNTIYTQHHRSGNAQKAFHVSVLILGAGSTVMSFSGFMS
jgi:hypothetical protein